MTVILVLLFIALCISIYFNIRAYANLNVLVDANEEYEEFFIKLQNQLIIILNHIKSVDMRGSFEADDEVGSIFFEIKESVNILNNFLIDVNEETTK